MMTILNIIYIILFGCLPVILYLCILYYLNIKYKINELNSKLNKNTFIISNSSCTCKKYLDITFYKCNKCKIDNLINFEDIDKVMIMFKNINIKEKLNIIIHTGGGISCYADAIAYLLSTNDIDLHTYIPEYAQSAGTIMAIAGNKIHCNWYSLFSPIDTQLDYVPISEINDDLSFSARHIQTIGKTKEDTCIDKLQGLEAKDHHEEELFLVNKLLKNNSNKDEIIKKLVNTKFSHEFNITYNDMKKMGLPVDLYIEKYIFDIFELFKKI
jgi:hypothetical protein